MFQSPNDLSLLVNGCYKNVFLFVLWWSKEQLASEGSSVGIMCLTINLQEALLCYQNNSIYVEEIVLLPVSAFIAERNNVNELR